jgi:tetratricopeptide (TPR) repeat protein
MMGRMNALLIGALCALCGAVTFATAAEPTSRPVSKTAQALRTLGIETPPGVRGDKAYRQGNLEEAMRQYGRALEETPADSPQRRLLEMNLGNTLYRQGRYPDAADYYEQSLKRSGTDSAFASRVHHNLGNTSFRKAEAAYAADSLKLDPAIADLREAVAHYKKALRMNAQAPKSKQNLERANGLLKEFLAKQERQQQEQPPQGQPPKPPEPSPRAKEALARALQLAQERRYAEAAKVLTDIMRQDPTAATFAAHQKRLDDVMKIMRGERPDDPAARDPRATPWKPASPGATSGQGGRGSK